MRLEKIKLAGFKSFVDSTTVQLPSNLVAVVGPNGCGKSNVIDAVRWVMGESSPRLLRGESMADVIFNGSSTRKPVGQAVIELLFDNSDGAIGGQYAAYAEIAVKRLVSRDGQSNYYLNNTRCRRRDITELFLGTGLGPRSYSIIEQGTISRLIEARPEELRAFLEEAAGISKYKERRRETEASIRNTRDNLERLNDLRDEVTKRLQHLQRQAAVAEKYQALQAEEQRRKGELLAWRWHTSTQEHARQAERIAELETDVATAIAEQSRLEASLDEQRECQHEAGEKFRAVQDRYYAMGTEVSRVEQTLRFQRESRMRTHQELLQVAKERTALEAQAHQDAEQLATLEAVLLEQEPLLARLRADEELKAAVVEQVEESMHLWQMAWDELQHQVAEPQQLVQTERSRLKHLEQQAVDLERRKDKYNAELQLLDQEPMQQELAALEMLDQTQQRQALAARERLTQASTHIHTLRATQIEHGRARDIIRDTLQAARNRNASLMALQQVERQGDGTAIIQWLREQHLDQAERLFECLEVSPPWQTAVEMVLGATLHAYCTAGLEQHAEALGRLNTGPLQLFATQHPDNPTAPAPGGLEAQVVAPWPLTCLLGSVGTAADIPEALARRHHLAPQQSLVTPNGVWVGRDWLRVPGTTAIDQGLLERAAELKTLRVRIDDLARRLAEATAVLEQIQQALAAAEQTKESVQEAMDHLNQDSARTRSDLSARRAKMEQFTQRHQAVARELAELLEQLVQNRELAATTTERLAATSEQIESLSQHRDVLTTRRDQLRVALEQGKTAVKALREQVRLLTPAVESTRINLAALVSGNQRLQAQLAHSTAREAKLAEGLAQAELPMDDLESELEVLLGQRRVVEEQLNTAKTHLEATDMAVREGEHFRQRLEQTMRKRREILDQVRQAGQELQVRVRTLEEQLKDGGYNPVELVAALPATDVDIKALEGALEHCSSRLQRLGSINLAAIDELRAEMERKNYLDTQHADISAALDTLEGAIRTIDRETKTRFKETFDQVNTQLDILFPRLFGGGQAYLELTGEDLLNAGVTVMARPPGKRNSSIHLLSGGEKALTAIALVFSIFQLNPAPFCMLDEVDAPLDDANVGRFCNLVRFMATQVQFIFITHNKVTMELANQLIGVTMHEPGVSRLVTVDMDEAVRLAQLA